VVLPTHLEARLAVNLPEYLYILEARRPPEEDIEERIECHTRLSHIQVEG
jgi:hypothetical protein